MGIRTTIITCNEACMETIKNRASKKFGYLMEETMDATCATITILDYGKFTKFVKPFIFHAHLAE